MTIPADVLSERAADQKIGEITGIEVRRRSEGGAAEAVRIEGTKGSMEIAGEYQIRKFLSAKGYPIQKNDGTVSREMDLLPSACFTAVPEKEGETIASFTFYGGGYGMNKSKVAMMYIGAWIENEVEDLIQDRRRLRYNQCHEIKRSCFFFCIWKNVDFQRMAFLLAMMEYRFQIQTVPPVFVEISIQKNCIFPP